MRVAVTDADGNTHAFRLGRIDDFVNPITGETHSREEVAEALKAQAEAEFPDSTVTVQALVDNGDDTSTWTDIAEVPEGAVGPKGRSIVAPELAVEQTTDSSEEHA